MSESMPDVRITLVHGTFGVFGRWVRWIRDGSPFRTALSEKLGRRGWHVSFDAFKWSGLNFAASRAAAAKRLREKLLKDFTEYPDAMHFLVGHSHGGSIVAEAGGSYGIRDRIDGVICLSTPFLHAAERPGLIDPDNQDAMILPFLAVVLSCVILSKYLGFGDKISGWMSFGIGIFALLLWSLLYRQARRMESVMSFAPPKSGCVLLTRHTGDEATGVLIAARFTGWLVHTAVAPLRIAREWSIWIYAMGLSPLVTYKKLVSRVVWVWEIICFGALLWFDHRGEREWFRNAFVLAIIPFAILLFFSIFFFASILLSGLLFLPPLIVAIISLPLSTDLVLASLFLDISAEATPEGEWKIQHFGPYAEGLRHSAAYNDPKVPPFIAKWVIQKVTSKLART